MKHIYRITIILFALMLLLPIAYFNLRVDEISKIDNKKLTEITDVMDAEDIPGEMEQFLTERIGFRNQFLSIYQNGTNRLLRVLNHPIYTYGKDGYVFFKMKEEVLDKEYLDTFAQLLKKMQDYYSKKEVPFLYCINPNKTAIYPDKLPAGTEYTGLRMDYLKQRLQSYNVNYMDNTEFIRGEAKKHQVFNVKYDAGHWNEDGAMLGIRNILLTLQKMDERIQPVSSKQWTRTMITQPYLPLSQIEIQEKVPAYEWNEPHAQPVETDMSQLKLNSAYHDFTHYVNPEHPELPKLLVFRGSYFLEKEKFFADSFSEVVCIHSYRNFIRYVYYYKMFKPDVVLLESVEYATTNHYFPEASMKKRLAQ